MASQSEHMSVTQSETQVESDQAALALDDEPVLEESGAKVAPHFPDAGVTSCVPNTGDNDGIADVGGDIVSIAVNANVEGVRHGGKAPEVLGVERLDVNAQTDLGMLYVRDNVLLFSLLTPSELFEPYGLGGFDG